MCGISGVINYSGNSSSNFNAGAIYRKLCKIQSHRGPDDHGWFLWDGKKALHGRKHQVPDNSPASVLLIHDRLAIIDLSDNARQPMLSQDGRYVVVYNGEIYNYIELRNELEQAGCVFTTDSDTEVFINAFAVWGAGCAARFTGMFAAAILDTVSSSVFLIRDGFGIKPLYYYKDDDKGILAFASEIKTLLELPFVQRIADSQSVYDFFMYGYTDHSPRTMFKEITHLKPNHYMRIDIKHAVCHAPARYMKPILSVPSDISFDDAAQTIRAIFEDNVRLHLRSDVPLGCCLSGGIDSSAIVMAMRKFAGQSADIRTFSFVPEDERISEAHWINIVVSSAAAQGMSVTPTADEFVEDIENLVYIQDEPFQSRSIYAQYRVMKLAAENGVKVILDGQGADELFAGYRSYYSARLATLIRSGLMRDAANLWEAANRLPGMMKSDCVLLLVSLLFPEKLTKIQCWLLKQLALARWMNRDWFMDRGVNTLTAWASRSNEVLKEKLLDMLERNSLPRLLHWEDRNSMAFSIESRVPYLTNAMAVFLRQLPENYLISKEGTSKFVLRHALRGLVPDAILDRQDKVGFNAPELAWAVSAKKWADDLLSECVGPRLPFMKKKRLLNAWERYCAGRGGGDFKMWQWLSLCAWVRRFDVRFE